MILDDLGAFLGALPEFTLGTDLKLGTMPAAPDTMTALYEYGGMDPVTTLGSTLPEMERPRIQVVSRAKSYRDARTLIDVAWRALCGVIGHEFTAGIKTTLEPVQSPFVMGRDDADRVRIGVNFQVHRDVV